MAAKALDARDPMRRRDDLRLRVRRPDARLELLGERDICLGTVLDRAQADAVRRAELDARSFAREHLARPVGRGAAPEALAEDLDARDVAVGEPALRVAVTPFERALAQRVDLLARKQAGAEGV